MPHKYMLLTWLLLAKSASCTAKMAPQLLLPALPLGADLP